MMEPRLIELVEVSVPDFIFGDRVDYPRAILVSAPSGQPPAILHANRDSRYEALKVYSLRRFGHRPSSSIYFYNSVDILYLGKIDHLTGMFNIVSSH
jgi:hypothetical protein